MYVTGLSAAGAQLRGDSQRPGRAYSQVWEKEEDVSIHRFPEEGLAGCEGMAEGEEQRLSRH